MFHYVPVLIPKENATHPSMVAVWGLREEELSQIAQGVAQFMDDDSSPQSNSLAAWLGLAIQEFQDLQDLNFPEEGRYLRANYLFFEGLSVLREAVIGGMSGLTHSSLATLRSALEIFVYYAWWQSRFEKSRTHADFYNWLEGKTSPPPFRNVVSAVSKAIALPMDLSFEAELHSVYKDLCSYSHKPILEESITRIRGSNLLDPSEDSLTFWLNFLNRTQRSVLLLLVGLRPQSLFPLPFERRFGFNPPIGWMFDESNFRPLRQALNESDLRILISHFADCDAVSSIRAFYGSFPDLSAEEILASWDDEEDLPNDGSKSMDEVIFLGRIMQKAKTRALARGFAYGTMDQDLRKFIIPK
jgi:hypothetical protein